jgi:hypothetical protein
MQFAKNNFATAEWTENLDCSLGAIVLSLLQYKKYITFCSTIYKNTMESCRAYSDVPNKHVKFLILFEKIFPTSMVFYLHIRKKYPIFHIFSVKKHK